MEINTAVKSLNALAQATRLDIFRYLMRVGPEGANVSQIRDHLGIPNATLSFHLSALKHATLISCRRHGRQLIYTTDYSQIRQLLVYLTEDCCAGEPVICNDLSTPKSLMEC